MILWVMTKVKPIKVKKNCNIIIYTTLGFNFTTRMSKSINFTTKLNFRGARNKARQTNYLKNQTGVLQWKRNWLCQGKFSLLYVFSYNKVYTSFLSRTKWVISLFLPLVFQNTTAKDVEIIENTMAWTIQGPPLAKTLLISGRFWLHVKMIIDKNIVCIMFNFALLTIRF